MANESELLESLLIRTPLPGDLGFMAEMEQAPENRIFTLPGIPIPSHDDLQNLIENPPTLIQNMQQRFICQAREMPVGIVDLYDADFGMATIWLGIIIAPHYRMQGLGAGCIRLVEAQAQKNRLTTAKALVHPLNLPAMSLFRACGYQPGELIIGSQYRVLRKFLRG